MIIYSITFCKQIYLIKKEFHKADTLRYSNKVVDILFF